MRTRNLTNTNFISGEWPGVWYENTLEECWKIRYVTNKWAVHVTGLVPDDSVAGKSNPWTMTGTITVYGGSRLYLDEIDMACGEQITVANLSAYGLDDPFVFSGESLEVAGCSGGVGFTVSNVVTEVPAGRAGLNGTASASFTLTTLATSEYSFNLTEIFFLDRFVSTGQEGSTYEGLSATAILTPIGSWRYAEPNDTDPIWINNTRVQSYRKEPSRYA